MFIRIDFKELGYKQDPYAISPYSNQNLPLVVTTDAEVYVDYRQDLFQELKKDRQADKTGRGYPLYSCGRFNVCSCLFIALYN